LYWCDEHAAVRRDLARPGRRTTSIQAGDMAAKAAASKDRAPPRAERLARIVAFARSAQRPISRAEAAVAAGVAKSAINPVLKLGVERGDLARQGGRYTAASVTA
jgi:hypothetical protein